MTVTLTCTVCRRSDDEVERDDWRRTGAGDMRCGSCGTASTATRNDSAVAGSWDRPLGDTTYAVVAGSLVRPDVSRAARAGCTFASTHLRVREPALYFYVEEPEELRSFRQRYGESLAPTFRADARNGLADASTNTIGVWANISPALAAEVAAHEVRHLCQTGDLLSDENEADAVAYGEWAREILVSERGAARVFLADRPWNTTGVGEVDEWDVLLTEGERRVYRNFGSSRAPRWVEHYRRCPVGPI